MLQTRIKLSRRTSSRVWTGVAWELGRRVLEIVGVDVDLGHVARFLLSRPHSPGPPPRAVSVVFDAGDAIARSSWRYIRAARTGDRRVRYLMVTRLSSISLQAAQAGGPPAAASSAASIELGADQRAAWPPCRPAARWRSHGAEADARVGDGVALRQVRRDAGRPRRRCHLGAGQAQVGVDQFFGRLGKVRLTTISPGFGEVLPGPVWNFSTGTALPWGPPAMQPAATRAGTLSAAGEGGAGCRRPVRPRTIGRSG